MRKLATLLLPAVAFAGCRGCDDPPTAIAPQIYIDACASPQKEVEGTLIGGFEECGFAFGERPISVKIEQAFKITNPSRVELTLENIELIGDPAFEIVLKPDVIGSGLSGDIVVSVRPRVEAPIETTLYILSDANNTEQTPDGKSLIAIPLTLTGVDNGVPDIEVTPQHCDFGRVPQDGVQTCDVTIRNTGLRGLVLDSVEFIPPVEDGADLFDVPTGSALTGIPPAGSPFAFTGRPPAPDEEIAANGFTVLPVRFTPDFLGNYQGKFRILSSDPDEGLIDVVLSGIAVTPPTCEISIKSINGQAVGDAPPEIEPLDNVVFTIDGSTTSTPDGSITRQQWSISDRPAGSQVDLTSEDASDTGFQFDNGDDLGVDLAGDYCVNAVVFDDLNTQSVNECKLCFEAIPKDNFLVQLSWDTNVNDIDLHVTQQASDDRYCIDAASFGTTIDGQLSEDCDNGLDCNFSSCKVGAGAPEWDGVGGRSDGDPSLDIDDLDGFGPENINVDVMGPGMFLIGVNGYTASIPSGCTVRVFIFGRLAGEFFRDVTDNDWWEVGVVRWPDGEVHTQPCLVDLDPEADSIEDQFAACDLLEQD